ncbi:hypothetical protein [Streptomyces sp. NPDC058252]|uniref:hypothetical protein n=1 Tax=Streptomyces sp. NPDC058252 TaxID=3346405 RepID=UPI0036E9C41B
MAESMEEGRVVHARIPYVSDREIHVSTVQSPQDGLFFDAREYIPSLDAYGRGLTLPMRLLHPFMEGVQSVWHENGAGAKDSPTEEPPNG